MKTVFYAFLFWLLCPFILRGQITQGTVLKEVEYEGYTYVFFEYPNEYGVERKPILDLWMISTFDRALEIHTDLDFVDSVFRAYFQPSIRQSEIKYEEGDYFRITCWFNLDRELVYVRLSHNKKIPVSDFTYIRLIKALFDRPLTCTYLKLKPLLHGIEYLIDYQPYSLPALQQE